VEYSRVLSGLRLFGDETIKLRLNNRRRVLSRFAIRSGLHMLLFSVTTVCIIPRNRQLLPQLIVAQLLEEFPARPEPQHTRHSFHKHSAPLRIRSQMNPAHKPKH